MYKKLPPVLVLVLFIFSCSDTTTVFEQETDNLQLETNNVVLENSLVFDKSGVLEIYGEDTNGGEQARFVDEQAGDYPLTLVAQVQPPSYSGGGENLTASHVHIDGDYAYVSYNTVNEIYAGGIDIIYVGDPNRPRVTSRLYYTNADISSLQYDNGNVYAVGGVDSEKSALATANSFVAKLPVFNGRFDFSGGITYGFQEGFVATDISVTNENVLMTSGKDGYVTAFDKNSLEIITEAPYQDLRSVVAKEGRTMVLDASIGVLVLDDNLEVTNQIAINSDFRVADKRTLDFSGNQIVVAEGERGAGIYNANTGAFQEYVPILIRPDDVADTNIVTNATALNDGALLMANGGAGLCLSEDNGSVDLVGIIELDGSINYVASKGDYIFAASGREGLQIIKMNKPSEDLEARCADTPVYEGSANLRVGASQTLAYSGSKRFRRIEVEGSLLLCGTWTVNNNVDILDNGLFEMRGTFICARNNRRRNITVGENATFRVEGDLTIYGDLILEEGATIEFIGPDSRVNIFGSVDKDTNANVLGDFEDIQGKF